MKYLHTATLVGLEARIVDVEATLTNGLPAFTIVGLPGVAIKESRERVKSALLTNEFAFPPKRITVNLSPSDLAKDGSHMDLAIALVIALGKTPEDQAGLFVFGELGLDGIVKESGAIFPILLSLKNQGLVRRAVVPLSALESCAMIPGIVLKGVASLSEAVDFFSQPSLEFSDYETQLDAECLEIAGDSYYTKRTYPEDFSDVKGQELAKRACLIAAAGMHNLLMEGSPGSGKSMMAKRLRYILPPLSMREILQSTQYHVLNGEKAAFRALRSFRSPHHSASKPSLFGGGSDGARIGEVALADGGILFFDEFPHFSKSALEALREPLQDHRILISRVNSKVEYFTRFLFVAAQNPCPCGNLFSTQHACRCNELEIRRYKNRLSEPLLDRIDLYVQMQETGAEDRASVDSATLHRQVIAVFLRQKARGQRYPTGKLSENEIEEFCRLDAEAEALLRQAIGRFGLSHRGIANIKKVARTIADLEGVNLIGKKALLEALSFRRRAERS